MIGINLFQQRERAPRARGENLHSSVSLSLVQLLHGSHVKILGEQWGAADYKDTALVQLDLDKAIAEYAAVQVMSYSANSAHCM